MKATIVIESLFQVIASLTTFSVIIFKFKWEVGSGRGRAVEAWEGGDGGWGGGMLEARGETML